QPDEGADGSDVADGGEGAEHGSATDGGGTATVAIDARAGVHVATGGSRLSASETSDTGAPSIARSIRTRYCREYEPLGSIVADGRGARLRREAPGLVVRALLDAEVRRRQGDGDLEPRDGRGHFGLGLRGRRRRRRRGLAGARAREDGRDGGETKTEGDGTSH